MEQNLVYGEASTKELMAFMQRPGLSPASKVPPCLNGRVQAMQNRRATWHVAEKLLLLPWPRPWPWLLSATRQGSPCRCAIVSPGSQPHALAAASALPWGHKSLGRALSDSKRSSLAGQAPWAFHALAQPCRQGGHLKGASTSLTCAG